VILIEVIHCKYAMWPHASRKITILCASTMFNLFISHLV